MHLVSARKQCFVLIRLIKYINCKVRLPLLSFGNEMNRGMTIEKQI